ncbi:MAG: hypothetical protein EBT87_08610, partial [Alphaproteobacteria bacterium]|nr:hypothetical protein [Alphaproteobacteria bacterium]
PPNVDLEKPFAMLATLLDSDPFLGRCLVGRVEQGSASVNSNVHALNLDKKIIEKGRMTKLFRFESNNKIPVEHVQAGDIICIAGLKDASVSDRLTTEDIVYLFNVHYPFSTSPPKVCADTAMPLSGGLLKAWRL